ncbi:cation:proton antiporter [Halieaceae bacterium IMCC14734]|uniref:Cation:proton antiporter n=1 Tax=Candidatus Litorirhabdus singularis TaxID=2518993 RepID=A0ABT3TCR6_9GAMM|nr:cation:proton antiporter [Candidatus Litorirhabdus singularis]MCX2979625.1 cation:proton antiporter [Candidatus Litorirhabdus singularis]
MAIETSILLPLGGVLLASLALESIGRRTRLPRVTLLILFGIAVGPSGLQWLPEDFEQWYSLVAVMALGMIGFLLGGHLTRQRIKRLGALVAWVSLLQVLVTYAIVALGLYILGLDLSLALLFAAIATATDPAATNDVVEEFETESTFGELLQGVVAIDDAWGLIVFSLSVVLVHLLSGDGGGFLPLQAGLWDLGGALLLGIILGVPMAYASGRLHGDKPLLVEALGGVFLCVGLAEWLQVSYLLACVTLGITVANLARHHRRPFRALEDIEWPFAILFFVLSGALLELSDLTTIGLTGVAYILLRVAGRLLGAWLAGIPAWTRVIPVRWMGPAMLPQAGVAMAMAIVAVHTFPEYDMILPIVIASTVIFELLGPLGTRFALRRVTDLAKPID